MGSHRKGRNATPPTTSPGNPGNPNTAQRPYVERLVRRKRGFRRGLSAVGIATAILYGPGVMSDISGALGEPREYTPTDYRIPGAQRLGIDCTELVVKPIPRKMETNTTYDVTVDRRIEPAPKRIKQKIEKTELVIIRWPDNAKNGDPMQNQYQAERYEITGNKQFAQPMPPGEYLMGAIVSGTYDGGSSGDVCGKKVTLGAAAEGFKTKTTLMGSCAVAKWLEANFSDVQLNCR